MEINVFEPIGKYEDESGLVFDGYTAQRMAWTLSELTAGEKIVVNLNSPGGVISDGIACYTALRNAAAKGHQIVVRIVGAAYSAAAILALAGDQIEIVVGAYVMFHEPSWNVDGTPAQLLNAATTLEKQADDLAAIIANRTGLTTDQARQIMRAETYLSANDAEAAGWAQAILNTKPQPVTGYAAVAALNHLRHRPKGPVLMPEQTPTNQATANANAQTNQAANAQTANAQTNQAAAANAQGDQANQAAANAQGDQANQAAAADAQIDQNQELAALVETAVARAMAQTTAGGRAMVNQSPNQANAQTNQAATNQPTNAVGDDLAGRLTRIESQLALLAGSNPAGVSGAAADQTNRGGFRGKIRISGKRYA